MRHEDRVIIYLKNKRVYIHSDYDYEKYGKFKGITVKECEKFLGTTELRKIMSNLKRMGYEVTSVWETGENRFGDPTRYKRYFVGGKRKTIMDELDEIVEDFYTSIPKSTKETKK